MALTEFGKYLRDVRIQRGELLKHMADRLGVSSSFLSSIENGRSIPPFGWKHQLQKLYELTPVEVEKLDHLYADVIAYAKTDDIDPPLGTKVRIINVDEIELAEGLFENGEETVIVPWSYSPALKVNNYEEKKHLLSEDRLMITRDEYHAIEIIKEDE